MFPGSPQQMQQKLGYPATTTVAEHNNNNRGYSNTQRK